MNFYSRKLINFNFFLTLIFCLYFFLNGQTQSIHEGNVYYITGENNLSLNYTSKNGVSCLSAGSAQKWYFESADEGYYYIGFGNCGEYLTGTDDSYLGNNFKITLEEKINIDNQQWYFQPAGNNKYLIRNKASNLALYNSRISRSSCGERIYTVTETHRTKSSKNEKNSKWELEPAGSRFPELTYEVLDTFLLDYEVDVGKSIFSFDRYYVMLSAEKWLSQRETIITGTGKQAQIVEKVIIPDNVISYEWGIKKQCGADQSIIKEVNRCEINAERPFEHTFFIPEDGTYTIELKIKKYLPFQGEIVEIVAEKRVIKIKNLLIVSIGDSVASGEGNPDTPRRMNCTLTVFKKKCRQCELLRWNKDKFSKLNSTAAGWVEPRAHRSNKAFPIRTAERLIGQKNKNLFHTTTLIHRATTGASIENGLFNKTLEFQEHGQIREVQDIIGSRKIDFLIVSIGANDIGFSRGLKNLTEGDNALFVNYHPDKVIDETREEIKKLESKFIKLDSTLRASLDINNILVTEYPTSFFDDRLGVPKRGCGFFNGPLLGVAKEITRSDARAIKMMAEELNVELETIAKSLNWVMVDGIEERFAGHGYCTQENSFYVGAEGSCKQQGDILGVLHPNDQGHEAYSNATLEKIRPLIPKIYLPKEPCLSGPFLGDLNRITLNFQQDFPAQWQQFQNFRQVEHPDRYFPVSFTLSATDLGNRLANKTIKKIEVEFVTQNGLPPMATEFYFANSRLNNRMTFDGKMDSTPSVSEEDWSDMIGLSPINEWILGVPNNETVWGWFENNVIQDIKIKIFL